MDEAQAFWLGATCVVIVLLAWVAVIIDEYGRDGW